MSTTKHVLPGEQGDDIKWFEDLSPFEKRVVKRQVDFKRKYFPDLVDGRFSRKSDHIYPYILPAGCEYFAFYQPIAKHILNYLSEEDIELHSEARNLKSSQVACLNFLFPLHDDLDLASSVLKPLFTDLQSVTGVHFEYTGPTSITEWLGEPEYGKRGKNRTSIDVAIFWLDRQGCSHASLVEWKYCEKNFGNCSTYSVLQKDKLFRCYDISFSSEQDPAKKCLLTRSDQKPPRRYWEHLAESGISIKAFRPISGCPFKGPFYQLMRQCELSAFLKITGIVEYAEVLLISFIGNEAILEVHPSLAPLTSHGKSDVLSVWNSGLNNTPPIRQIYIDEIMKNGDINQCFESGWRTYIFDRYGI